MTLITKASGKKRPPPLASIISKSKYSKVPNKQAPHVYLSSYVSLHPAQFTYFSPSPYVYFFFSIPLPPLHVYLAP